MMKLKAPDVVGIFGHDWAQSSTDPLTWRNGSWRIALIPGGKQWEALLYWRTCARALSSRPRGLIIFGPRGRSPNEALRKLFQRTSVMREELYDLGIL